MFYVRVQQLDYDDYPEGGPTNIGPFDTTEAAEAFLENSSRFRKMQVAPGYAEWQQVSNWSKHSVNIRNVGMDLSDPERWM